MGFAFKLAKVEKSVRTIRAWRARRFREPCANSNRSSPRRRPASSTWLPAAGRMGSSVRAVEIAALSSSGPTTASVAINSRSISMNLYSATIGGGYPMAAFQTLLGLGTGRKPTAYNEIRGAADLSHSNHKLLGSAETTG